VKEPTWEEEKEKRRQEALERHARLHKLFLEDRLAFEREKRNAVQGVIDSVQDQPLRKQLLEMQALWDKRMRGAGSASNRFVLAQTFFWDYFHNVWNPKMQELNLILNGKPS
jgi:hypothetical protein